MNTHNIHKIITYGYKLLLLLKVNIMTVGSDNVQNDDVTNSTRNEPIGNDIKNQESELELGLELGSEQESELELEQELAEQNFLERFISYICCWVYCWIHCANHWYYCCQSVCLCFPCIVRNGKFYFCGGAPCFSERGCDIFCCKDIRNIPEYNHKSEHDSICYLCLPNKAYEDYAIVHSDHEDCSKVIHSSKFTIMVMICTVLAIPLIPLLFVCGYGSIPLLVIFLFFGIIMFVIIFLFKQFKLFCCANPNYNTIDASDNDCDNNNGNNNDGDNNGNNNDGEDAV